MLTYPYSYYKSALKPEIQTLQVKELAEKKNAEKIVLLNTSGTMNLLYMNDIYNHAKISDFHIYGEMEESDKQDKRQLFLIKTLQKGWLINLQSC
jgi:hypothetical protein